MQAGIQTYRHIDIQADVYTCNVKIFVFKQASHHLNSFEETQVRNSDLVSASTSTAAALEFRGCGVSARFQVRFGGCGCWEFCGFGVNTLSEYELAGLETCF